MYQTFDSDRFFLENKYHRTDEPFNPFRRMCYHGEGYDPTTGLDDDAIVAGLRQLEPELAQLPHSVAKATAIAYVLRHQRLYTMEHDYFVGIYSLNRLAEAVTKAKWFAESRQLQDARLVSLSDDFNSSGAVTIWTDYDHVVPDWKSLMELGFYHIRERVRACRDAAKDSLTDEKRAFLDAMELEYTAVLDLIDRMYQYALTQTHGKAGAIAQCLKQLRTGAPTNIYEAMQLILIYFLVSESVDSYQVRSLGNGLDFSLFRFYEHDLQTSTYTRAQIQELLAYFLMQWSAIGNYWGQPFYLGGTDQNGETKYNDLSRDILRVYAELGIYNPKIQLKINTNTPKDVIRLAYDMIRQNRGSIVFCCEPGMIKAVMGYGATYEEALDMDIRGCYETGVRANEVCSSSGYVNAAMAVCYVFTNGYDERLGKQIGVKTGELSELVSFEDFYSAFLRQWTHLIRCSVAITNDAERFLSYVNPSMLYSATIDGSVKKGLDAYQCGVKFNNNALLNCAFATAVDSLMAVKEFVYDTRSLTLAELKQAMDADWQGFAPLQRQIRNSVHKYGNGDRTTDRYSAALAEYFCATVNNVPNSRGGVYKAILHSARQFIDQGSKTCATPDGRNAGAELSKNASPSVGMDKNGVTALLSSAVQLKPPQFHESFCVDVLLHPSTLAGEDGFSVFHSLLLYYLNHDGMSIQFNVFDASMLRDAQEHPEKYGNLQVRVCGWNVLWNNLCREEQDAYILRAESVR